MTSLILKSLPVLFAGFFGLNQLDIAQPSQPKASFSQSVNFNRDDDQEEPVYSTETRIITMVNNCWEMQVSVYATYPNGQVYLKHSATIQTGPGCKDGDKVLSSETYSKKSGPEYIIHDDLLNGPIQDFFRDHDDVYQELVLSKEKKMGIQ